jgi:hypothetical protein
MATTLEEKVAAERGYPTRLLGLYTPKDAAYWHENLHWLTELLKPGLFGLDPHAAAKEVRALTQDLQVSNDMMAPRFPAGTVLAGKRVKFGDLLSPGEVFGWYEPHAEGPVLKLVRLAEVRNNALHFTHDNHVATVRLSWRADCPAFPMYRITHYVSLPLV